MRLRSLATVLATSGLLAAAVLRCAVPPLPPDQQALATRVFRPSGAFASMPAGAIDRGALIASLREMKLTVVVLEGSAAESLERTKERVSFAVELQRDMPEAVVFASTTAAQGVADELTRLNANDKLGCYLTEKPELVDSLTDDARTALHDRLRDAAAPCVKANRAVLFSYLLSPAAVDPERASVLARDVLQGTGITTVILQDGVGTFAPTKSDRASKFYLALRVALEDREEARRVWANVEAFECEGTPCTKTHATTTARYTDQLCATQRRVQGMFTTEYLHDLAGQRLVSPDADAGEDAQAAANDLDASAQLRRGYLEWLDAGASCVKP